MKPPIKYLSLFSGIGGFELGIGEKGECVGYSEINKYAIQVYERHFDHKELGDITKVDAKSLPDFELLVGGFPCQAFSIAGKRAGFDDTRGTLFFEIARIAREKQPRLLLLENVKGLLSHDKGRTFLAIITTLDELGYDLQWQVLNSKNFGVPQNRERVFIVGHLRETRRPEVFPLEAHGNEAFTTTTVTARYATALNTGTYLREVTPKGTADAFRIYEGDGLARTLKGESGGCGGKTGLYEITSHSPRTGDGKDSTPHTVNRVRRLTPTECERLQGFPDGWTEGISDTQRYKCLGNAVTVNVIRSIIITLDIKL